MYPLIVFFLTAVPISAVLKCFNLDFLPFDLYFLCCCFFCDTAFHYSHSSFFPFPTSFFSFFKAMRSRSIGECALPSAYIRSAKSAPVLIHPSKPFLPDIVLTPLSDELSGSATSANFCTPFHFFNPSAFKRLHHQYIFQSKMFRGGEKMGKTLRMNTLIYVICYIYSSFWNCEKLVLCQLQ